MTTENVKVAKAMGVRKTNIDKVESVWNGCLIYVRNRQKVWGDIGAKQFMFAHHSQIAKYRAMKMEDIILGCEPEMK